MFLIREESLAFFSHGSGFYCFYSWASALRYIPDSLVPMFCMGFPSERGDVEELLQHGRTLSQVQGGLWQSPWPGYCAGPRTELGFGFSILTLPVWMGGSTGGAVKTLEWSSCPLFSSTREKRKYLVWILRECPSAPLSLAGLFVWRILPWPVYSAPLCPKEGISKLQ